MAIKKSELYSSIWKSCDELRGGMDASQYKDYILILLFLKYVTDKYEGQKDAPIYIPPGAGFKDIGKLKGNPNIGEEINRVLGTLAYDNELNGVIDTVDFQDDAKLGKGKARQDRLTNLVAIFENENLDFSKNRIGGDDLLGDAYEYLMRHFATESGKSKGQFYTPAEVSRVIAKIIGIHQSKSQMQTLYDPTCGSGSLLLKAADEAPYGITIYGQEMDLSTYALARMNMILHDQPTHDIRQENTLSHPQFTEDQTGALKTFDFAVANPPFSSKAWTNGVNVKNDPYRRFDGYGAPPDKNGDYAFLLHLVRSLKSDGKGAIILPHGVLFRGNAEGEIRKNIIKRGYIKGIIGLPANLFYGTGIPACIIVMDKENAAGRKGIFMIDAGKGFAKDGNKNRLREQDIHKIVDVFNKQMEMANYSRLVPVEEIGANGYNLNIPRYIDTLEPEDIHDIQAHLCGGIPAYDIDALRDYWEQFPSLKDALFTFAPGKGYYELKIPQQEIKQTIFSHPGFVDYIREVDAVFASWKNRHALQLKQLDIDNKPKQIIHGLAEDILQAFASLKLIDKYDIYQHLMTYWLDIMQDDVYMISLDGWNARLSLVKNKKDEWDCDLVPKALVINRYFEREQKDLRQLEADRDDLTRQKEEMEEEHGGEDGVLEAFKSDSGKVSRGMVSDRIKEIRNDKEAEEELGVLNGYLLLSEREAEANKKIKEAKAALDKKVIVRYRELSQEEIKTLVVDDKWLSAISLEVKNEMERISQRLTRRINELVERYAAPLSALSREVEDLSERVNGHLKKMGLEW
jgi:type I restriction enzyme M protein